MSIIIITMWTTFLRNFLNFFTVVLYEPLIRAQSSNTRHLFYFLLPRNVSENSCNLWAKLSIKFSLSGKFLKTYLGSFSLIQLSLS